MAQQLKGRATTPDGVLVRELEGESVLLNLNSESYFGLDGVGTRMWAALTTSASIEAAYETLLAEYEVEPEHLRADLSRFVEKLAAAGLIDVSDL
jgi:Coenzyme PQQ synthesis protein D (PqqD)